MITLAKALKVKNRLAGKLKDLQDKATKFNVTDVKKQVFRTINLTEIWAELETTRDSLIDLKGKIAVATAAIAGKLQEMSEYKSQVSFFERLPVEEGMTEPSIYNTSPVPFEPVEIKSYIDEANRQSQIQLFKKKIEDLQDEVDTFNATTQIDFQ
jgi:hypothetical protein